MDLHLETGTLFTRREDEGSGVLTDVDGDRTTGLRRRRGFNAAGLVVRVVFVRVLVAVVPVVMTRNTAPGDTGASSKIPRGGV